MKSERLLEISLLLLNRGIISSRELAERYEVSDRTIYRDIEALCEAGIPIVSYPGRNGGYGIMEGYKVDRQLLKPAELSTVITALKGLSKAFGDGGYETLTEKMKSLSQGQPLRKRRSPEDYLFIDFDPGERVRGLLKTLRNAIEEERLVHIDYSDTQGNRSERDVEPMALSLNLQTWYFYGFCRLRENFRLFKVSRIREIKLLTERFILRSSGGSLKPWEFGETKPIISVLLRFSPQGRHLAEDFFGFDGVEVCPDGSCLARMDSPDEEWLYRLILGYGPEIEVLEPESVRLKVGELIETMGTIYPKP